jgi:small GTP-binding protein
VPMPHRTQMQVIKRRLAGKEGRERTRELRAILDDLPNYKNGPYADIRKWVLEQIEETRVRSRAVHRDSIAVRREGAAQIALVGPPNAGKSSLLHALSEIQIKIGNYAFTTLRPVPALVRIHGVLVQLVEIPGLIDGANDDRGGGRALLGVLRNADAIVFCHDLCSAPDALAAVRREVAAAGIERPSILAATKLDDAPPGTLERLRVDVPDLAVLGVSVLDDGSLDALKHAIWDLTGLIRVFLKPDGRGDSEPLPVRRGSSIAEVAAAIHKDLARDCHGARVWGASARFDGQRVGRDHIVQDGDRVEILTRSG